MYIRELFSFSLITFCYNAHVVDMPAPFAVRDKAKLVKRPECTRADSLWPNQYVTFGVVASNN